MTQEEKALAWWKDLEGSHKDKLVQKYENRLIVGSIEYKIKEIYFEEVVKNDRVIKYEIVQYTQDKLWYITKWVESLGNCIELSIGFATEEEAIKELDKLPKFISEQTIKKVEAKATWYSIFVYTYFYNAFVMGGKTNQAKKTKLMAKSVGNKNGIKFFEFQTPTGETRIVEENGGIVGDNLEAVFKDIDECDDYTIIEKQLEESKKVVYQAEEISNEEFFKYYK